jgi:outer membrane protein assembly factor BamB
LLLLAGCGGSKVVREEPAKLEDIPAAKNVKKLWAADSGASAVKKAVTLWPSLDDNIIYTSDPKGRVTAFAADSGRKLWKSSVDRPVTGAAAAGNGLVVIATKKGEVIALDSHDGHRLWVSALSSQVVTPAAVQAGVVVVQSVDGKLAGLSVVDGKRLWLYERSEPPLSLYGTAAPVMVGNVVLAGFATGKMPRSRSRMASSSGRCPLPNLTDAMKWNDWWTSTPRRLSCAM